MNKYFLVILTLLAPALTAQAAHAEGLADSIGGLQGTLDQVYQDMMPMFSGLTGVGRAVAGFGALWYIGARVWRHLANAEAVDFYPLLRPFALGICISLFPVVITVLNGLMQPVVTATGTMVRNEDTAIARLLKAREDAVRQTDAWQMYEGEDGRGDQEKWYQYTHPGDDDGSDSGIL